MDEKRTGLAVLISICAILLYSELVMDPYIRQGAEARAAAAKVEAANKAQEQVAGAQVSPINGAPAASSVAVTGENLVGQKSGVPAISAVTSAGQVTIENDYVRASLSLLGGRLISYQLKRFNKNYGSTEHVELVAGREGFALPLGVLVGDFSDAEVTYAARPGADGRSVVMSGKDPLRGIQFTKSVTLAPTGYLSAIDVEVIGSDAAPSIEWNHYLSAADGHAQLNPVSFKVMSKEDKLTNTLAGSLSTESERILNPRWIGFGDRYFLATLIPNGTYQTVVADKISQKLTDESHVFAIRLSGATRNFSVKLYGGPKTAEVLAEAQPGLERTIDLGWFSFLAFPLLAALKILFVAFQNWGLAIVALTLVLKALFLPLTKASFASMQAMQSLAPEMKEMRERIKDPAVLNQEMLKLYQKHKVNPMGGCFPILLQVPVFIGLYNVLLNAIELRHAPFALWIQDLSSPEALMIGGISVPLMVLLLGVSMFLQQYSTPTAGLDPTQRKVMLFMPVILTGSFLIYPLPAGLTLYWLVNNTISVVQQVFLKTERRLNPYQATAIAGALMLVFAILLTKF
jgi:YidC/Oxa1 family membrane protein insertase